MLLLLAAFLAAPQSVDSSPGAAQAGAPPVTSQILARVAEEVEAFAQNIPETISQETFEQRAVMPPSRFHPRIGKSATEVPKARLQVRQIVSEYTIGTFKETASRDLHEFRQVLSVDGRAVQSVETARRALSLGLRSEDDRLRKRMLESFARYGLVDIATDYGLILLEFSRRGMENLEMQPGPTGNIGADAALGLLWKQKTDAGGQLEFAGRRALRQPLAGILWVRASDGLPLRVETWAEYSDTQQHVVRNQATVDYTVSAHGFLTPVSVIHRHLVDGKLLTENLYHYEPFKMFRSDAEIKFTELPEPPPETPKPIKK